MSIHANRPHAVALREAVYYDATDAVCGPKGPPLQEPAIMSEAVRTMMRMDAEAAQETGSGEMRISLGFLVSFSACGVRRFRGTS